MASEKIGISTVLCGLTSVLMASTLYLIFYAPPEKTTGLVQRIFYFHVSSAWIALLAFLIMMAASIAYLAGGAQRWDVIAHASAEVGTLFCTLVLVTGSFWAKAVWKAWWTKDPRLTTTLLLWLLYAAYLGLRKFATGERSAKYAAVFGVLTFLDVPIVYFSLRWQPTQHPATLFGNRYSPSLTPETLFTLLVSLAAFLCLYLYLLQQRVALARMEGELEAIRQVLNKNQTKPAALLIENQNFIIEEYTLKEQQKS